MLWIRRTVRGLQLAMQMIRFPGVHLEAYLPVLPQDAHVASTYDADLLSPKSHSDLLGLHSCLVNQLLSGSWLF